MASTVRCAIRGRSNWIPWRGSDGDMQLARRFGHWNDGLGRGLSEPL